MAEPIFFTIHGGQLGPFSADAAISFDNSPTYQRISGDGVKIAEGAFIDDDVLHILEAKNSIPRNQNITNNEGVVTNSYHEFINEICEQLQNSLIFCAALAFGRHSEAGCAELPIAFTSSATKPLKFILYCPDIPERFTRPQREALSKRLRGFLHACGGATVEVWNRNIAERKGVKHLPA